MTSTASTFRGTDIQAARTGRGNHPAGRALLGPANRTRVGHDERSATDGGRVERPLADVIELPARRVGTRPSAPVQGRPGVCPPLRLTRRGRRLVVGLLASGGLVLAGLLGWAVQGGGPEGASLALAGESSVVVQPGDTLWSIAGDIAPQADVRGVVDALQAANDLDGPLLVPGQILLVP